MLGSVEFMLISAMEGELPTFDQSADTSILCSRSELEIVPCAGVIISHEAFDVAVKVKVLGPPAPTSMYREGMGMYGSRGERVGGGQL